jgi:RNA polymerase sigma-70 factor (ECF subfamily)
MNDAAGRLAGPVLSARERVGASPGEGAAEADAREFEARLADSSTLAFRVAYSVLRQKQDAEDVAQDAFVRAHRRFSQLRDRDRFRGWIARMTFRLAIDRRRSEMRRSAREVEAVPLEMPPRPDDAVVSAERAKRLWSAIDQLPEKLRLVTVLAAIEGQSVADVAGLLGAPEGTIKSRLFDARKILAEKLR